MYRVRIDTHRRLMRGEKPLVYVLINTAMGDRVYAERELSDTFDPSSSQADGSLIADGSAYAGNSMGVLDKGGRLLRISGLNRTIAPASQSVLSAYSSRQLQHITVQLQNEDRYFSRLLVREPFLGCSISVMAGFPDLPYAEHLSLFKGIISGLDAVDTLYLEAEERWSVIDTLYLGRTGRYAAPLNNNDRLPYVYGDLTDSSDGNWIAPCIDTVNHVYCYAAHAVLSVAGGNSISVYVDGVLQSSGYTFSESNNYEGLGNIATITFAADQANAIISVRGKGYASGGALVENIIDIVNDVLVTRMGFDSSIFNATRKASARDVFESQSYKAAGVIHQDIKLWDLLTQMMGTFLGSAYLDGDQLLCLDIDTGGAPGNESFNIVNFSDIIISSARQTLENVINRCPCSYAYDYVLDNSFKLHTDDSADSDVVSTAIYGERTPTEPYRFYWCRHLTTVSAVQAIIVTKFKNPLWQVEMTDSSMKRLQMDVGDYFSATVDCVYDSSGPLYNHTWRIVGVQPDLSSGQIKFAVHDAGTFVPVLHYADGSVYADGSYTAGNDRDTTLY